MSAPYWALVPVYAGRASTVDTFTHCGSGTTTQRNDGHASTLHGIDVAYVDGDVAAAMTPAQLDASTTPPVVESTHVNVRVVTPLPHVALHADHGPMRTVYRPAGQLASAHTMLVLAGEFAHADADTTTPPDDTHDADRAAKPTHGDDVDGVGSARQSVQLPYCQLYVPQVGSTFRHDRVDAGTSCPAHDDVGSG